MIWDDIWVHVRTLLDSWIQSIFYSYAFNEFLEGISNHLIRINCKYLSIRVRHPLLIYIAHSSSKILIKYHKWPSRVFICYLNEKSVVYQFIWASRLREPRLEYAMVHTVVITIGVVCILLQVRQMNHEQNSISFSCIHFISFLDQSLFSLAISFEGS